MDAMKEGHGVQAIVLTYDAPEVVRRCVEALLAQSVVVDSVLVIDNASPTPIAPLFSGSEACTVVRTEENLGPAGGVAFGLARFLQGDYRYCWLMDDDCVPIPTALEEQLATAAPDRVVLASVSGADGDEDLKGHGWWGALVPRDVVERVGLPNADLFWWTEDTEYLQWRIPRAGFDVRWTERPVMGITRARADATKPAWKYYYEARNQVYFRLHTQRTPERPRPENLLLRVRAWRALRSVWKLAARVVAREREDRLHKLACIARGAVDGVRGRLGKTMAVTSGHRPDLAAGGGVAS
jgi:rhamnopyranosyl-N-acetylglucosaminyl-diphospho-decaprenol beta-1,3/1,4-galactofuranosyltransferase